MDLIVALFIFFVVGPIIAAKITFRNIRNDIKSGRIRRAPGFVPGKFISR